MQECLARIYYRITHSFKKSMLLAILVATPTRSFTILNDRSK
jgi:hypothetical protein